MQQNNLGLKVQFEPLGNNAFIHNISSVYREYLIFKETKDTSIKF